MRRSPLPEDQMKGRRIFKKMIRYKRKERKMKNRWNLYVCVSLKINRMNFIETKNGCGAEILTRDVDRGVTPIVITCKNCGGTMTSRFYRIPDEIKYRHREADAIWRKPTEAEYALLDPNEKERVDYGGLILEYVDQETRFR
jgi:transcription elongation factor Elf1